MVFDPGWHALIDTSPEEHTVQGVQGGNPVLEYVDPSVHIGEQIVSLVVVQADVTNDPAAHVVQVLHVKSSAKDIPVTQQAVALEPITEINVGLLKDAEVPISSTDVVDPSPATIDTFRVLRTNTDMVFASGFVMNTYFISRVNEISIPVTVGNVNRVDTAPVLIVSFLIFPPSRIIANELS